MQLEMTQDILSQPIDHAKVTAGMDVDSLIRELDGCGFGAGRLAEAVDIYCEMLTEGTTNFFGLAGAMVPAGMRTIIADLIRDGFIDVLVTTGANMVHDIVESLGLYHYKGTDVMDDMELKHEEINRLHDVFLPEDHFVEFEEKLQSVLGDTGEGRMSIRELMAHIGSNLEDENSILKTAADMDVPVYCPAVQDSMIGLQAWLYKQTNPLEVDVFADMGEFLDICHDAERAGAMLIGGGVPKNYILQSMLSTPNEFSYAIQLTMDTPQTGGSSGATLDEARSWGEVGEDARSVTVYSDATITFPIIVAAARSRLENSYI